MNALEIFKKLANKKGKLHEVMQTSNRHNDEFSEGYFQSREEADAVAHTENCRQCDHDKKTNSYEVREYDINSISNASEEVDSLSEVYFSSWN